MKHKRGFIIPLDEYLKTSMALHTLKEDLDTRIFWSSFFVYINEKLF